MDDGHAGRRRHRGAEGRPTNDDASEVVMDGRRRAPRWSLAGIAAAAVLAVPGGMAISSAFAADGAGGAASPTQSVPAQSDAPAPQERGDRDRSDCPGKGDRGDRGGPGESGTAETGFTQQ